MYASLTTFKTALGKRAEAEGLVNKVYPVISVMKGSRETMFLFLPTLATLFKSII